MMEIEERQLKYLIYSGTNLSKSMSFEHLEKINNMTNDDLRQEIKKLRR